jgi:uncharacterized SAM-binding protein YcdF (DUF218 family)
MNSEDAAVEKPGIVASPRVWGWPTRIAVLVLASWALAGFFMEGEDKLDHVVPWLVVLGGGVAEERLDVACQLFSQGHGRQGVVLTGGSSRRNASERAALVSRCGVPGALLHQWPNTANSFEELSAVATMLSANPGTQAIVVSDALHMPRLRYVRDQLALNGRVYLRQSRLGGNSHPAYLVKVAIFWFREPLAYIFYRLRY